jgi:hypothetical protein
MTAVDARESLKGIAARARTKTRPIRLSIRIVWDTFERRCNFELDGFRFEVFANRRLLFVELHSDSGVLFSTPRTYADLGIMSLLGQVAGRDMYVNEQGRGSPVPWIYSPDAVAALSSFEFEDEELLTVTLGGPQAIFASRGPEADWERLQKLAALARVLPPAPTEEPLDPQRLPEDLRDLFPLLARWAVPDDLERSDLVAEADTAALQELVDIAEPRLPVIASFLAAHGDEDSAEAFALDALAQCVMEARQELTKRSKVTG